MMNVSGIRYLLIFVFSALTLSGCEDPEVSIGSLGKKFQAPSLTGASPFDQDMNINGYVRFQGSCDSRVSDLYISMDETQWFQVPATPIITNTNLTGTEVNDASCETDGHFDFYLTKTDLTGWGYAANVDVDAIFVRGTTIIGETQVLKIQDNKTPGTGNGSPGVASQVVLEKTWPTGFAGSTQCEYFNASVRDANNYFVTSAVDITFSLDKKVSNTVYPTIGAYKTLADCLAGTNMITTFTILGGKNHQYIYYRFPDAPLDGTISFRASDVSLATTTSAYIDLTLRDSTAGMYWMTSYGPYKIGKGMCTKGNFEARYYNGTQKSLSSASAWTPVVTGTNSANLFFYSDASCVTRATVINGNSANTTFYIKYTGTEPETSTLSLTIGHTIDTGVFGVYDDIPQKIEIDRSGNQTLAHFDFYTPDIQTRGACNQTQLSTHNSQGTLVSPNPNILVTFASTGGALFFATAADCDNTTNSINAVGITLTSPQTPLYYRVLGAPGSTQSITMSSTGLTPITRSFVISDKATTVTALFNGFQNFVFPAANTCTIMKVEAVLSDVVRDGTLYTNNFGESKMITVIIPTGYTHYSDASCLNPVGGNTLNFNLGEGMTTTGQFTFYMQANTAPAAAQFNVYQTSGGASGYLGSTTPNITIGP